MKEDKYLSFITTDPARYIKVNNEFLKNRICDNLSIEYSVEYENLINLFCSNKIGLIDENEIFTRLINESISLDFLLYLVGMRYRDHYIHQFNVASLGEFLLSIRVSSTETLLDTICMTHPNWHKEKFLKAWWITSLLHDHAYPIDFLIKFAPKIPKLRKKYTTKVTMIDRMKEIFKDTNKFIYSNKLNSLVNNLFDGTKDNIVDDLIPILEKELDTLDLPKALGNYLSGHHIFGAINLIYWLREANDKFIDQDIYNKSICRAIFLHHIPVVTKLSEDPLSFLLKLCDTLQEWGRPRIIENEFVSESENILIGPFLRKDDEYKFSNNLNIVYQYNQDQLIKGNMWNYNYFVSSKNEELKFLDFRGIFEDFNVSYEIHTKQDISKIY